MSYREKTAALMISLRFNVGYIWYGCCSGPGSVGKHRVGIFVLEHPSWRDPQKLAEFPGSFQKSQTYFFFCVCVQYLINILPLQNQGRVTFGAILGCSKEKFGFVMAVTGLLRPTSHALFVISNIPTLQMIDEHVMGSSVAQHE